MRCALDGPTKLPCFMWQISVALLFLLPQPRVQPGSIEDEGSHARQKRGAVEGNTAPRLRSTSAFEFVAKVVSATGTHVVSAFKNRSAAGFGRGLGDHAPPATSAHSQRMRMQVVSINNTNESSELARPARRVPQFISKTTCGGSLQPLGACERNADRLALPWLSAHAPKRGPGNAENPTPEASIGFFW